MAQPTKKPSDSESADHSTETENNVDIDLGGGLGGFLGGFGNLIEKLGKLAEAGQSLSQSGEIKGLDPGGKARGVYGVSFKTGLGERGQEQVKVEPFGNIRRQPSGEPVIDETREPLVDVHEEDDHVLVLAEIPGVSKENVELKLSADRLTIFAERGEVTYRKEVVLPEEFPEEQMAWECNNGILKIRFDRQATAEK